MNKSSATIRSLVLGLALLGAFGLAGCGDYDDSGYVYLWNRTDTTVPENVVSFTMGPDGGGQSGNLLLAPAVPGDIDYIGEFEEFIYDGVAELQGGTFVDFFNFFVGNEDDTVLQVF